LEEGKAQLGDRGSLTHGVLTYDPDGKTYRSTFMGRNWVLIATGSWDEKTNTMTWHITVHDGNTGTSKHRFTDNDHSEWSMAIRNADGEVVFEASAKETRVKKAPEGDFEEGYFEQLDTNGDGAIDVKEAKVMADYATSLQPASVRPVTAEQLVFFMDTNRDGKISKDEFAAMMAYHANSQQAGTAERKAAERVVSSMDANRDGKIGKDEISAVMKPYFEQIDTNGDGAIDANEAWGMAYSASSQQAGSKGPGPSPEGE
jgi:Ca2+-binding EF-hand superfamily protein